MHETTLNHAHHTWYCKASRWKNALKKIIHVANARDNDKHWQNKTLIKLNFETTKFCDEKKLGVGSDGHFVRAWLQNKTFIFFNIQGCDSPTLKLCYLTLDLHMSHKNCDCRAWWISVHCFIMLKLKLLIFSTFSKVYF